MHSVTSLARFAVVTVTIDAVTYVIVDIGMRMLTPRELARAQGFPDSYVLDPIGPNGKPLSKSSQIRMIGNSSVPDVAEALVAAERAGELGPNPDFPDEWDPTPTEEYRELWIELHGKASWDANPDVLVLTFRLER
jgi:hypothetical protein